MFISILWRRYLSNDVCSVAVARSKLKLVGLAHVDLASLGGPLPHPGPGQFQPGGVAPGPAI